jgi:phage gp46-like protein
MTATSSAIRLADLALIWGIGRADLAMIDSDLASDTGLTTAVLISLLLDRRADEDDVPPSGDINDLRGWWADQFSTVEGDRIGSRLWMLDRSKRTAEVQRRAVEYVREALAWMLEDRVVASIDVETELTALELLIGVTLHRPGRDPVALRFAHVWDSIT